MVPGLLGIGPAEAAFDTAGALVDEGALRKADQLVHDLTHFSRGGA